MYISKDYKSDPYMNNTEAVQRLVRHWLQHGKIIIAYDFDDTVYDNYWENCNERYKKVIKLLKDCEKIGAWFIVYTCRDEDSYPLIKKYLDDNKVPYDKINENIIEDFIGGKIYYNIFLDDKAGLSASYKILKSAFACVKEIKKLQNI